MSSNDHLLGGKGGGSFRNRPDNLRSTDTFETLLGISSSFTRLAPGGLKNVFVDGVPVEDGQGNASFSDFVATLFEGDPTILEPIQLKLGGSGGATSIGLTLSNDYPAAPGEWKTGAISAVGVDFLDLRFVVQSLYNQTKKGIGDATATIEVELRPSGSSTWINPLLDVSAPAYSSNGVSGVFGGIINYALRELWDEAGFNWKESNPGRLTIQGKTSSAYVKELRIAVPNTGAYASKTWEVRCRLLEKDYIVSGSDGENETRRTIQWESLAGVTTDRIGGTEAWRGVSWLQIYGKATDQISGIPEIKSIVDLGRHLVPPASVWNPLTQTYTGSSWDGVTYVNSFTQCPAWQIKGLIEDDLSGVSALAPGSTMNKWDVLEASKWFGERVPDGRGGTQPRYQLNWYLEQPMQVKELVNWMAGAVGGFAWDEGDGRWRMKVERPENPVMTFTKENIVGEFVYSHTDADTRFNDFTGVFRNEEQQYQEDRVRVFDQVNIDETGRRHTTVALVGCTNRQEALRRLKLRKLTALNETRQVTFTTNRQGNLLEPLSVISIADGDLTSDRAIRSTGRILSVSGDRLQISVRDHLRLELGVNYSITVTIPNPQYNPDTSVEPTHPDWRKPTITITRNVVNTAAQRGDVLDLYLDSPLPASTPLLAPIALSAPGLPSLPKQYRVTNVTPDPNGELVAVQAIEIYTAKFALSDAVTEDDLNSQISNPVVPPPVMPAGGMFEIREYTSEFQTKRSLTANWVRPATLFLDNYKLEYRYNGGPWIPLGDTRETYFEMQDPIQGFYDFRVYTRDRRGALSLPLMGTTILEENMTIIPVAELTNASVSVPAASDGTVASFADTGGSFVVRSFNGPITEGVVYAVVSTTGGLSITIDPDTGVYLPTDLSSNFGTALLSAVYAGSTFYLTYTIAKAVAGPRGDDGISGLSTAAVFIYKRASTEPTDSPADGAVYTFADGTLTGTLNGWTTAIPAVDGNPLWVRQASAISNTPTDTIPASEWSSVQQGAANGAAGGNTAVVYIYQRAASAPLNPPSNTLTYTFATGGLSGSINNGWSASIPDANGLPLWVRTAVAFSTGATDTIASGEWSSSVQLVQDGASGANAATVFLYTRSALPPPVPSTTSIYTFATGVLTGANNGWSQDIPVPNGNPLYVTTAAAISTTATDNILSAEWAEPVVLAQDGIAGLNNARILIYRRAASLPSLPTGSATFTFATGGLTGLDNGWTTSVPNADGSPLWVSAATASSLSATDVIAAGEWATPVILAQDGASGTPGLNTAAVFIYQRASTAPAAPTLPSVYTFASGTISGLNNGWTTSVPAADGNPLWVRQASASSTTATDTIPAGEWSAPQQLATDGVAGGNTAVVYIYQRAASSPTSPPTNTLTYTFASGVLSGTFNNGWSATIPTANGQPLWVRTAIAFSTGTTDTIATGEWSSSVMIVRDGEDGLPGANAATVFLYRRSASVPAVPSTTSTYTFATGVLAGANNSWVQEIPAGADPLYVITAAAISVTSTDSILSTEWSSPVLLAQDGDDGLNTTRVLIYRRAASLPSLPTATTTFTFATGGLTGLNNGWTTSVPAADGNPLWVSGAVAASTSATDTLAAGEWATPVILAQDGAQGPAGLNNAAVFIYKRAAAAPADAPATGATYTFATGALTGTLNGWTTTVPTADGNPIWVRQASASSTTATDTIAAGEWSAVQQLAANGGNTAVVFVYARGLTAPAAPTTTTTYTFASGVLTGTPGNGWTQAVPAANGQPLWVRTAVAFSSGTSDTIAAGEWSGASQIAADGSPGPAITLVSNSQAFTFTDNVADPSSQTITIEALLTNLTGTVTWSTSPSVTLTGTGNTRTLSLANFGTNRQVVITATLGGITQTITIFRQERNINGGGTNRVYFSRMEGNRGWQATFSSSGLPFTPSFGDFENRRFFSVVTSATSAGQNFNIGGNVRYRVTAGERLSVQARLDVFSPAATGGNWFLRAVFFNAAGTASFVTVATGNGPIGASTITAGFIDVPAGQVSMIIELGAFSGTSGAWTLAISEPMVTSALAGQTLHPPFSPGPNSDDGADVTAAVTGPVQVALAYNSVGALQTSLPVTESYKLIPRGGVAFTTGVSWSVSVLAGSFTGAAPTITGAGTGQLSINSDITSAEATLQITASVSGLSYPPMIVKVIKEVAVAFSNPSLDDTLGSPASSVYSVVGEVTITLGNATTAVNLNAAALTLRTSSTNAPAGTSTLEFKWMRETAFNSGTFVDVGGVATSSPDPGLSDPFGDGFLRRDIGSVTCNRTATGLTASTEQRFRLMGRISGGNIRVINVGGTVSVTV